MTIIHQKKIDAIDIINNNDSNIVASIEVEFKVFDDELDNDIYSPMTMNKRFTLETSSVDPTSNDFIDYNNLTEDQIFSWIESRLNTPRMKEFYKKLEDYYLKSISDINLEPTINKELPWSNS